MNTLEINQDWLRLEDVYNTISNNINLTIDTASLDVIQNSRDFLDKKVEENNVYYGINTGFGALYNTKVSIDKLSKLQENLLLSHACGLGEYVPAEIIKLMLLTKVKSLSKGYSSVQPAIIKKLIEFYNQNILPVIYKQGSLGASGDLSPLAHLSLPLIHKGQVWENNKVISAENISGSPIALKSKEGLALINGTQFILSYGIWCLNKTHDLIRWADIIASISLDAYACNLSPFHSLLMNIRPHKGQITTSKNVLNNLLNSEIQSKISKELQDPYSFRCIPQVHGAVKNAYHHIANIFECELNSVTDNPTVFMEEDKILSGGNFHAEPLALTLDYLSIALSELASISERRIYKLISGNRNLPSFLVSNPGINSGFMIPQYTAASIVSQNKQLCTPASVDSIDSSNGQEDHVSMGANAATKCFSVVQNVEKILAIELFTAFQALEFRKPFGSSDFIQEIYNKYRTSIPTVSEDVFMHQYMIESITFIQQNTNFLKSQLV